MLYTLLYLDIIPENFSLTLIFCQFLSPFYFVSFTCVIPTPEKAQRVKSCIAVFFLSE